MNQPPGSPPGPAGPPGGDWPPRHAAPVYGAPPGLRQQQGPSPQNPHGQPQNPHGQPQNPYGQPSPYGQPQNPYGQPSPYNPAPGFGAGYIPPIQPPEALDEPSLLHRVGGGILALLTLLVAIFSAVTDIGPFAWLAEAQAAVFDGEYYPVVTFLFTWMILLFLMMPVWLGVVSAIEGRNAFRVAFKKATQSWNT